MDVNKLRNGYDRLKQGTLWSSSGKCKGFAASNPGEASQIDRFVTDIVAGGPVTIPTLSTATGQGIIEMIVGGYLSEIEPVPVPTPASSYLNNLGEFGKPVKDWNASSNWLSDSARLIGILKAAATTANVAISSYGVAIATAKSTDPLVSVTNTNGWGNKPTGGSFRCPTAAQPAAGTDGHLVVVQPDGSIWEMWKAVRNSSGGWTAGSVGYALPGQWNYPVSCCRGSSFTLASGLLTPDDFSDPKHALLAILPTAAVRRAYMYPSNDSDGERTDGIPEGARIVLDPGYNTGSLTGMTKVVALAMQRYGAYVGDKTGGSDLSFAAVAPQTWTAFGQPDKWAAIGYSGYPNISAILPLIPYCRIENQTITNR